jgi:hypothetical protein
MAIAEIIAKMIAESPVVGGVEGSVVSGAGSVAGA